VSYLNRAATAKPLKLREASLWSALRAVAHRHDIQWHRPLRPREAFMLRYPGSTVLVGRTKGEGADVGCLYSDATTSPWGESLGEYRPFSDSERASELGCIEIAKDCDEVPAPAIRPHPADSTAISPDELIARLSRRLAHKTFTFPTPPAVRSPCGFLPLDQSPTSTKTTSTPSCNPHLPPPMTIALAS